MNKLILTTALALCIANPAWAGKTPQPSYPDARVKTLTFHDTDVFRITAHYGFSTVIEFANGENIETISLGDSQAWQTVKPARGNLLFIKPLEQRANTNMTVVTNERLYTFELTADNVQSHRSADLSFRIKFVYPNHTDMQLANLTSSRELQTQKRQKEQLLSKAVHPEDWNFDYTFAGDESLRPKRAFDDSTFTYFQFPENSKTPAVFSVDKNGNEAIVNYSMQGKYLVVKSLGEQFTFRDGDVTTCIFNDSYTPIAQNIADNQIIDIEDVTSEIIISTTPFEQTPLN